MIERSELPEFFTHRLSRYEVYPATLIGRLAADQPYRGERIGERLLLDALARALKASPVIASLAEVTDAKTEEVRGFYQHYGFMDLPTGRHERRLFLPMPTVEKLFGQARGQ